MSRAVSQLIPVDARDNYFVVSEDWLIADVPFPDIDERRHLPRRGYKAKRGIVHIDGRARTATIFEPPMEGDQAFADLEPDEHPDDPGATLEMEAHDLEKFVAETRSRFGYAEGILPEQRSRIETGFVEPQLVLEQGKTRPVGWDELRNRSYVLVTGAPGSGKTTLLRHWLLWHANRARHGESKLLPLCLTLRNLRSDDTVENALRRAAADVDATWLGDNLKTLARKGNLAIAFDGLDEVPTEERESALARIANFTESFPDCRYLVTSRPEVSVDLTIGLERARILPFDIPRVRQLAYHRLHEYGTWKSFAARVEAEPALDWVVGNPLAISLVIARYIRGEIAPSYVSEIVAAVIEMFIDTWDASRGILRTRTGALSPGEKWKILTSLATHRENIESEMIQSNLFANDSDARLASLSEHTGLLKQSPNNKWVFLNDVFEEYFRATSWVSALLGKAQEFVKLLRKPLTQDSSTLVRFMGFMSSDAGKVIERLLKTSSANDLRVAVHLTDVLSQRLPIKRTTLIGYANLVASTLELKLKNTLLAPIGPAAAGLPVPLLQISTTGMTSQEETELAALIAALHRSRDGVGAEALRLVLDASVLPHSAAVLALLTSDGQLRKHFALGSIAWTLEEVLPEVSAGPADDHPENNSVH